MNFGIFLLILGFRELVTSLKVNNTGDDPCHVCTLSYFRRKRAHSEYTRWYANLETTQEFIVKVLDDDVPVSQKPIAAINIQPPTKAHEKIIISGVVVPSPTTEFTSDNSKEYTRFVPPTTLSVTNLDRNIILAPIKPFSNLLPPIRPKGVEIKNSSGRHSQRGEGISDSHQFLPRSQTHVAQQYAPIVPVSFTRRNTIGPLTPRTVDNFILQKTTMLPTRTFSHSDIIIPTRTSKLMNLFSMPYASELINKLTPSRSTSLAHIDSYHTSSASIKILENNGEYRKFGVEEKTKVEHYKNFDSLNKSSEKENELFYNDLFYNDENDISIKTHATKRKDEENIDVNKSVTNLSVNNVDFDFNGNVTEADEVGQNYEDEDVPENVTVNNTPTTLKTSSIKEVLKIIKNISTEKKSICSILRSNPLTFSTPQSLHEIVMQLKQWADVSPVAKWLDITNGNYTIMENPIHMMIVDDPSSGQIISAKKTVLIVAGIQGRDHHAVTAAMYVLYQLIERSETRSELLSKFRFWIIPVFNPDGYDYSITFPHRREWSKNLRQSWELCKGRDSCRPCEELALRCTIQPCYGVNLDRNFEYQWIPPEELRAEHPCGMLYAGPRQLSEMETNALTHFLHEQKTPIHTFIAFKEGEVLGILYPYSHTHKRRALDHVHRQRASRAAAAAYSISGRPYVAGQASEFLPLYAGGIEDWIDGHLGIDNTYTVMMFRPNDAQNSKLATERVVHEAYAAIDTLLLQNTEPSGLPHVTLTRAKAAMTALPPKAYTVIIIYIIQKYA